MLRARTLQLHAISRARQDGERLPGRLEAAPLGETEPASLNDTDSGWVGNSQFEEWEFIHPRSEKLRAVDIEENVLVKSKLSFDASKSITTRVRVLTVEVID
jgi:hypothetical protein